MQSPIIILASIVAVARCSPVSHGKIMRNNMLLSKMMSDFHKENLPLVLKNDETDTARVVATMQGVLCRNFPSIPCNIIKKDKELTKLIYKSVGQLTHKQMEQVTREPHGSIMPFLNSEELSFYKDGVYLDQDRNMKMKRTNRNSKSKQKNYWLFDLPKNKTYFNPATGRKKVRTFYPHKTKYKDTKSYRETAEKFSLSNEMPVFVPPEAALHNHRHMKSQVGESPRVQWRIDYARHSAPNGYGVLDQFKEKLVKSANFGGDANLLQEVHSREHTEKTKTNNIDNNPLKHPDLYIKKNVKKHYVQVRE